VAVRALTPATRRRLGRPSPHQQADTPRGRPLPPELSHTDHAARAEHPVLATVSRGYPRAEGRFLTCYSPVRRFQPPEGGFDPRLACVKPAASVRPEPGSNSPLRDRYHQDNSQRRRDTDPKTGRPSTSSNRNYLQTRRSFNTRRRIPIDGEAPAHTDASLAFGTLCSSQRTTTAPGFRPQRTWTSYRRKSPCATSASAARSLESLAHRVGATNSAAVAARPSGGGTVPPAPEVRNPRGPLRGARACRRAQGLLAAVSGLPGAT
jgi:hypothetical protein